MARVVVIGAGIAGLTAAVHAHQRGHQVVILDRSSKIGGRGTSEISKSTPLDLGPHLLEKGGPTWKIAKTLSRMRPKTRPLTPESCAIVIDGERNPLKPSLRERAGYGLTVQDIASLRKGVHTNNPLQAKRIDAIRWLTSWSEEDAEIFKRRVSAFLKGKLHTVQEGWGGIVGRMSVALEEVGVPIEGSARVESIDLENKGIRIKNGPLIPYDYIILAADAKSAEQILLASDIESGFKARRKQAEVLDLVMESDSMRPFRCVIESPNNAMVGITRGGKKVIQAVSFNSGLTEFLDRYAPGWKKHVTSRRFSEKVTVFDIPQSERPSFDLHYSRGILLAGSWVDSEYWLADAATDSGIRAGLHLPKS